MDTLLIVVTAVSLALAVGMALVVVKLIADDRKRSEARVAALTALSDDSGPRSQRFAETAPGAPAVGAPPIARSETAQVRRQPRFDDLEIRREEPAAAGFGDLFAAKDQPSPWGRRVAVIGALAAVLALIGFGAVRWGDRSAAPSPAHVAAPAPTSSEPMPLELLSLRHLQRPKSLTVTGLVQNPRAAAPLSHVVATAFLFGADGAFLSSSRAPLDFTTLAPGDESPFVVTAPVSGVVARYRIGFRAADGRVIPHVDKRGPDAVAGLR
jgi:hypothetical protein